MNPESQKRFSVSRTQIITLTVIVVLAVASLLGRQFGWLDLFRREPVAIPSGVPYAEAMVIGVSDGVMFAERTATKDAQGNALQKRLEILTDKKTVFAKITSSGPVKISRAKISAGDIVWIYRRVRSLEEVLKAPADPKLAVPFADMLKNPRERLEADFVVKVSDNKQL